MLPLGPCTLTTRSDAPPGSGLGSSGALDVALVAALSAARGETPRRPGAIADLACRLEGVEAAIPGGRQDQFAAAFGGFLRLEFRDPDATVEPLALDPAFLAELERRMVLCYTGASRFSGATIARVMRAYERGDARGGRGARTGSARSPSGWPTRSRGRPRPARALLERELAAPAGRSTRGMCTPDMAAPGARRCGTPGALGGKAAGSGAGGCMFFLAPDDPAPPVDGGPVGST